MKNLEEKTLPESKIKRQKDAKQKKKIENQKSPVGQKAQ